MTNNSTELQAAPRSPATLDHTESVMLKIVEIASSCSPSATRNLPEHVKTVRIARKSLEMDKAMADDKQFMAMIKSLCGNEFGFGADKDYDEKTIRRAVMTALVRGANLSSYTGPEWMILSGKCYLCKPYYLRKLRELDGISNVVVRQEKHEQLEASTAYVPVTVELRDNQKLRRWEFTKHTDKNGVERDYRIPVRVNSGMIVDGIHGKAEAKALNKVYTELTGEVIDDYEDGEPPQELLANESTETVVEPLIGTPSSDELTDIEEATIITREQIDHAETAAEVAKIIKEMPSKLPADVREELCVFASKKQEKLLNKQRKALG